MLLKFSRGVLGDRVEEVSVLVRVLNHELRSVRLFLLQVSVQQGLGSVEPAALSHELLDVGGVQVLFVVSPSWLVVNVCRFQFGQDAFRGVTPGAVESGVVADESDGPR